MPVPTPSTPLPPAATEDVEPLDVEQDIDVEADAVSQVAEAKADPTPLAQIRKALVPLVGTFAFAVGAALLDGNLTVPELLVAAGGALTSAFGTYAIRNAQVVR